MTTEIVRNRFRGDACEISDVFEKRELALLKCLTHGMTNEQAGKQVLNLSMSPVQVIRERIILKFRPPNEKRFTMAVNEACLAHAIAYAVDNKLLSADHLPKIPADLFSDFEINICEQFSSGINVFELVRTREMSPEEMKNIFKSMRQKANVATNLMLAAAWARDRQEIMRERHAYELSALI